MPIKIKLLITILISFWVLGIFIEFVIPYMSGLSYIYPFAHELYSTVCHQQQHKLLSFGGNNTLVCSRCSGIYIGGLFSSLILLAVPSLKVKDGRLIILAALPMLVDVLLYSLGFYNYSKTIALITGLLFGFVGIVYIYYGLQILVEKNAK